MAISIPRDANKVPMVTLVPSKTALAVTNNGTLSSAVSVTLNTATTYIQVTALTKPIYMRWGAVPTSSAFDEFILANTTQNFAVPLGRTSVQFLEQAASATLIMIEK